MDDGLDVLGELVDDLPDVLHVGLAVLDRVPQEDGNQSIQDGQHLISSEQISFNCHSLYIHIYFAQQIVFCSYSFSEKIREKKRYCNREDTQKNRLFC